MKILLNEAYIKHLSVNQRVVIGAYCMLPAENENYLWKISFPTPSPPRASMLLEAKPMHLSLFPFGKRVIYSIESQTP